MGFQQSASTPPISYDKQLADQHIQPVKFFMELHRVFKLLNIGPILLLKRFTAKHQWNSCFKPGTWEKCQYKIHLSDFIKQAWLSFVCFVDLCKQVGHMVGLSEVIQDVVIFSMNAELFKFVLESSRLFK